MKYSIIILLMPLLLGFSLEASAQKKSKDQFTIQVDGLGCPFCAYGLEKKFKEFKGIKNVKIDVETGIFTFSYPAEKALAMTKVEKQVEAAGYTPVYTQILRSDGKEESNKGTGEVVAVAEDQLKMVRIFVAGNCGMCKARIEKTANGIAGVTTAEWDKKSKMLKMTFDQSQTSKETIAKAVAASGHDTKTAKADKGTYEGLPGCCQYERVQ